MNSQNHNCRNILELFDQQIVNAKAKKPSDITEIHKGIRICQTYMQRLRLKVLEGCIQTIDDEIHFFKHVKPHIMGHLLYLNYLKKIFEQKPLSTEHALQEFLENKLHRFNHFLKKNHIDHAYFRNEGTKCDELYFVRCNLEAEEYNYHPYSMVDSDFATSKDYLFADFIAHEKIIGCLEEELIKLKITKKRRINSLEELLDESPFYWTESKIALIELTYALTSCGCINNGNIDIKELCNSLCKLFHIDKLDIYRLFIDLKARKKNQTVFLDKLKENLINRMEEL